VAVRRPYTRISTPDRRSLVRPLACVAVTALAMSLPETPLAISPIAGGWSPDSADVVASFPDSLPAPAERPMSQTEFDLVWGEVKYSMAACNSAVEAAQLGWRARGEVPTDAAVRAARERCARASVEVGEVALPASARDGVATLLRQAREACQRSMIEKQMGLTAVRRLAAAAPNSFEAYEARIRIEAVGRSSITCGASFAAAAEAARLNLPEMEVAGA
jgi:hypothetical protein